MGVMPQQQGRMKRHPTDGAIARARTLRRQMTAAERTLWHLLRHHRLDGCKFRRQVPIGRYIADFVCHEAKLIIEVDGGQHARQPDQELRRTDFLASQGFRILRFWNTDILSNPQGVLMTIAEEVRRHHPHPPPPPSRGRDS